MRRIDGLKILPKQIQLKNLEEVGPDSMIFFTVAAEVKR
jgi:hypothetical protein